MNQNKQKNKTKEFNGEMDFYIPLGAILVELKDSSDNSPTYDEANSRNYSIVARVVGGKFFNELDKAN